MNFDLELGQTFKNENILKVCARGVGVWVYATVHLWRSEQYLME